MVEKDLHEIRNPKSEIRRKSEARNPNKQVSAFWHGR